MQLGQRHHDVVEAIHEHSDNLEIDAGGHRGDHRYGADMGKTNFAGDQRLHHRGRTANLDILDIKAMFFVDAAVDRDLDMIRGAADVGNADFGDWLGVEQRGVDG